MSEENIENVTKSDSNFAPTFLDHPVLPDINFDKHCLINNNISISKNVINADFPGFTLGSCLFRSKVTKDADLDKYK